MFGSARFHAGPTGCLIYPNYVNRDAVRFLNLSYSSQHPERDKKQQLEMSEQLPCERGIFLVISLYGEMSTDVGTGYTMEHYRNVCQQWREAAEM